MTATANAIVGSAAVPMIHAEGLGKRYGAAIAVHALDLSVAPGSCLGLLGANGSGKSTTIQLLSTLLSPSHGVARIAGCDLVKDAVRVRAAIGLVFQETALDRTLTVRENLRFAGALYGMPQSLIESRATELLTLFELESSRDVPVGKLSGGMRRAVDIARGLLHRPQVLLLDEPTTGLDPINRRSLWRYLQRIRREHGTTLVVATHLLDEAGDCDEVLFMRAGQVIGYGQPRELTAALGAHVLELCGSAQALARFDHLGTSRQLGAMVSRCIRDPGFTLASLDQQALAELDSVTVRRVGLEDVYVALLGRTPSP